jgi:hypothetical protein
MLKRINFKIYFYLFIYLFVSANLFSQEAKWIQIGALHDWFAANGCAIEVGLQVGKQQNGLRWPAFYEQQDIQAGRSFWIGASNFKDIDGIIYNAKVITIGPRTWGQTMFFPVKFTMLTRFPQTNVFVDGMLRTSIPDYVDGGTDPNLPAYRVIYNVVNTSIGIQMTRTIYAFSHQLHDNYFIYEYEFKNTGDCNNDGIQDLNNTLEGVYFYFQNRYACTREACIWDGSLNASQWATNTLYESMGDDENSTDPFRAFIASHGNWSALTHDNIGGPNLWYNASTGAPYGRNDGHLGAAQYAGWCTIYADKSYSDKSDDRSQPKTVTYEDNDSDINTVTINDIYNATTMSNRYAWMTRGYKKPKHHILVGDGTVDSKNVTRGGYSMGAGYGPYTIPIGESIRIVVAEGVAGLNRDLCYSVGADWLAGACTYPGITGNDAAKNAWVATGRDSILQTFQRATDNWNSGLKMPQPPEPPTIFDINSGGDRISISWSNSSESDPTLKGYRLYRADSARDNRTYKLIAELPKGVTSYNDMTPVRGYNYFYYLQCVGDGSNNGGVELVSNRQLTQTYEPAYLMRQAVDDMDKMADIRIVPNPFNLRSRDIQYKGEQDKIMFLDIPGQCTIRIYTERGDLIKTIEHTNGSGDETWFSNTEFRQVIVSGIYIAHFETPDGRSAFRKFIVIR